MISQIYAATCFCRYHDNELHSVQVFGICRTTSRRCYHLLGECHKGGLGNLEKEAFGTEKQCPKLCYTFIDLKNLRILWLITLPAILNPLMQYKY